MFLTFLLVNSTQVIFVSDLFLDPPEDSNISVKRNGGTTLNCESEGSPDPIYQWIFYSLDGADPIYLP